MTAQNINIEELLKELDPETLQALERLLAEIIQKYLIATKIRKRKALGWSEVNEAIENAPFCERQQQIVSVLFCGKCYDCRNNGICYTCKKKMEFITISAILLTT